MSDTNLLRAVAERPGANPERKQLQRFDWLETALEIFVAEGIDAVRITRLADDLDVTRGSFYWHFNNREDLIDALVDFWRSKNTPALTASFDQAKTLEGGILGFFENCIDTAQFDPRLDLAIREWARRSTQVRDLLDQEDQTRIDSMRQFFIRFDYPPSEALIRARVLYFSQIGFYALDAPEPLDTRLSYTADYYQCFTGRPLTAATVEHFQHDIIHRYGDRIA
jgi:AcrR family transcriptional regulator